MGAVAVVATLGCGGDDDSKVTCSASITGDVEATDPECSTYICETAEYDDLSATQLFMNAAVMFTFRGSLPAAGFTAKTYTLADLDGPNSEFSVKANGKTYQARTSSSRTAEETATLDLTKVVPAAAGDPCSGAAIGTISVSLVEISDSGAVGTGRVQATVSLTE